MAVRSGRFKMRLKNPKGASAIEFAIILPVLLLLIFGIIEFSLLLYNKQVLTNASREGARAGIVSQTPRLPYTGGNPCDNPPSSIDAEVQCYCSNHLVTFSSTNSPPTTTFDPETYDPNAPSGTSLKVTVNYTYEFLVFPPIIVKLFGGNMEGTFPLKAVTVMRME
jgi:hypothetical protein